MYLGKNIKFLRLKFSVTGDELAERLGKKGKAVISNWENGRSSPDAKTIYKLAQVFQISLDDLFFKDLSKTGFTAPGVDGFNVKIVKFTSDVGISLENQFYHPGLDPTERNYIAFRYEGDQLGPCIRSRDIVYATHIDMEDFMSDGIYVFHLKDQRAYTKIARKMANGEYMLYSNSGLPPITIQEDDIMEMYKVKSVLHNL